MNRLLVAFDGSGPALEAARLAGYLAGRLGAEVTVLTVGQPAPLVVAATGMVLHTAEEQDYMPIAQEGVRIVESAGSAAHARVSLGDPAHGIVDTVRTEVFPLVVLGHRGMGGVADLAVGSVAKAVAEHAPCPVIVVRERAPATLKRILVAVDGSEQAHGAVETAIVLAGATGAEITLLHALDPGVPGAVAGRDAKRRVRQAEEQSGHQTLEDAAQLCQRAGISHRSVLAVGRPAEIILKRARVGRYDLLALGRRGLGGIARLRLGGVSDELLRRAECPVLLVGVRAGGAPTALKPQPD